MTTTVSTGAVLGHVAGVGADVWMRVRRRRLLIRVAALRTPVTPCLADVWTGVATVTVHSFWSPGRHRRPGVALPSAVAVVGLGAGTPARRPHGSLPPAVVAHPVAVLVVWVANLSLGESRAYAQRSVPFAVIAGRRDAADVPGLGNLDIRPPREPGTCSSWRCRRGAMAGRRTARSQRIPPLVAARPAGWRLLSPRDRGAQERLSGRVALLLVPALVRSLPSTPRGRVSSPSLDVAAWSRGRGRRAPDPCGRAFDGRYVVAAGGAFGAGLATRLTGRAGGRRRAARPRRSC